jgi:hypothetical protein
MTDPFVDVETAAEGTDSMSQATDPTSRASGMNSATEARAPEPVAAAAAPAQPQTSPQTVREFLVGKHVCPFCGTPNPVGTQPCPRCTMDDTPATRQATKSRIGPWYVLQSRNPAAPGMRFSTLLTLVQKSQVSPRSIVRGPTTHQLWRYAAHVRGLSREFGLCYSCGEGIQTSATICPHCERSQEPPANADQLIEVRDTNGHAAAAAARVATREYELPPQPAAYPPARAARGEHAERLRLLNAEGSVNRARPELRRDGRAVSAIELVSALQNDDPAHAFEPGPSHFGRVVGALVLLLVVGGGVFLYLNPDYRIQASNWIGEHWRTARQKVNSFELQKHSPPANPQVTTTTGTLPAENSRVQSDTSIGDRRIAPSLPPNGDDNNKVPADKPLADKSFADKLIADAAQRAAEKEASAIKVVETNKAELKKAIDVGNATPPDVNSKAPDVGKAPNLAAAPATNPSTPSTQPALASADNTKDLKRQDSKANNPPPQTSQPQDKPKPPAPSPADSQQTKPSQPQPSEVAARPNDEPPARPDISESAALEKSRTLRKKAIDAESAHDFANALKYWEEIKKLPKSAWPGDLQNRIEIAKALRDEK